MRRESSLASSVAFGERPAVSTVTRGITSPITLRGHAPVTGPSSLRPGHWDGTLLGSEFTGDFNAER